MALNILLLLVEVVVEVDGAVVVVQVDTAQQVDLY
jgi:hypothetical protein